MSDPGKAEEVSLTVRGHTYRVNFEKAALIAILAVAVVACAVAIGIVILGNKDMADRMSELTGPLTAFLGVLGSVTGFSWTRGHMDRRIDQ